MSMGKWKMCGIYPLVMTNSSPWYRWPIEIDGLPFLKMVICHGELLNNQRVMIFTAIYAISKDYPYVRPM